jgi:anti-anti-sigma factor
MAVGTVRIGSPDPSIVDEHRQCGKATFAVRRLSPSRHAVAVIGDIDAENGRNLGRFVEEHTGISRQLVLDLRAVDFAGTQAFTALYYISVHCSRNDVDWIIVGSHPVRRLLIWNAQRAVIRPCALRYSPPATRTSSRRSPTVITASTPIS